MLMASGYDLGPLQGIPIAVKDNIDCDYGKTTYGSSIFREYQADKNAIVVSRLKKAGAIIVGKTNLHEFAWEVPPIIRITVPLRILGIRNVFPQEAQGGPESL